LKSKEKNKEIFTLKAVNNEAHTKLYNLLLAANSDAKIEEMTLMGKTLQKASPEKKFLESPPQTLSFDSPLFIDKEFLKNNIGDSLITLKAKFFVFQIFRRNLYVFDSASHFIKDNNETFQLIGGENDLRIFANRIKREALDVFETNLWMKIMEKVIKIFVEKRENMGDFNFMIFFTILFFVVIASKYFFYDFENFWLIVAKFLQILFAFFNLFYFFSDLFNFGMVDKRNHCGFFQFFKLNLFNFWRKKK